MRSTTLVLAATAAVALSAGMASTASAAEQEAYAAGLDYVTPVVVAAPGDTLRFNNEDPLASHTITSDTPGLFNSGLVADGASALVAGVDKLAPGTYQFHCVLHSWMHGAIEVASTPGSTPPTVPSPPSGAPGVPSAADLPNPVDEVPHAAPAPLTGGDWPFYGQSLSNTRDGGVNGPAVSDVPFLRPVWSVKSTDGDFTGTPVESGGTVVAVSGGGTVFAIDASTGKTKWTADVTNDPGEFVNGTAAIAGASVFVPISKANGPEVAALSLADGSPLWKVTYDTQQGADTFGSPVVWDGKVLIGTSGQNGDPDVPLRGSVTALDAATGAQVWKTLLVPPGENGAPVWTTPAVDTATNTIYVGTGNAYSGTAADTTDAVLALDGKTGAVLRHFQATANDDFTTTSNGTVPGPDADFGASPQLMTGPNGQKLVGEGQKSGTYWALDRATLTPVWSFATGPGSPLGGIIGSTAYDGTRIYGPDTVGGEQWALGLDGTPAWASADGGPLHDSATSVANGVVYTTDMSGVLTAREASTGAVLLKLPLGAPSWGGVSIAGGYVFAVTGTQTDAGYVVGYRADTASPYRTAHRRRITRRARHASHAHRSARAARRG